RLQLRGQPHSRNGDDGLGCEGLEEGNLAFGEKPSLRTAEVDRPNGRPFSHQGNAQICSVTKLSGVLAPYGKLFHLDLEVSHMDRPSLQHRSAVDRATDRGDGERADRPVGPIRNRALLSDEA